MKKTLPTIAALLSLGAATSTSNAATIAVLDSWPSANGVVDNSGGGATEGGTIYDLSTGGDSIGGITGTFEGVSYGFAESSNTANWWTAPGDLLKNAGFAQDAGSGTFTFDNLPANTFVEVYINWVAGGQANNSATAQYVVNGSAPVVRNNQLAVPSDLVLTDPDSETVNFALLGEFNTGLAGQIEIVASAPTGTGFVALDAAAIVIPEPSSTALLGLGGLALLLRRRK